MKRWHRGEEEKSWRCLTAEDANNSNQREPGGRGVGSSRTDTAIDECRNDCVARYKFD